MKTIIKKELPNINQLKRIKKNIGKKHNKLKITKFSKKEKSCLYFECLCDCGNKKIIKEGYIISGHTKSCGCLQKEAIGNINKTHGMSDSSFHNIWMGIKARCNNKKLKCYKNYGGRGITYDERWNDFLKFKKDMYQAYVFARKKYRKELTKNNPLSIERKDNKGNYCKDNCIWIPMGLQAKNTRKNKWFKATNPEKFEYISNNQYQFAKEHDLNFSHIGRCLRKERKQHKGWTFLFLSKEEIDAFVHL